MFRSRRQRQKEAERLHRLHLVTAIGLLPFAALAIARYAVTQPVEELVSRSTGNEEVGSRLDPNSAPWWELTALPGIGETRAKAIVEYRTQALAQVGKPDAIVFRRATDLEAVKGIGPKTATRMAPHLRFPPE
ncbi:MAG: helix-hairpin-helix domain-containing protein [Planctomycetota bacterium]